VLAPNAPPTSAAVARFVCVEFRQLTTAQVGAVRPVSRPQWPRARVWSAGRRASRLSADVGSVAQGSGNSKIASIQAEIDSTKVVMQENIERMRERGENLDSLQDKTGPSRTRPQLG